MADFSLLPDVVWVHILSYFTPAERSIIAQTCGRLYSLFSHPSLWYKANVITYGSDERMKCQKEMIDRYGMYIQDLNLSFISIYKNGISHEVKDLFCCLAEKCHLESLTLCGESSYPKKGNNFTTSIDGALELLDKAYKLKQLDIKSWPIGSKFGLPSLSLVLTRNAKTQITLENLSLFWISSAEGNWTTNVNVLSISDTLSIIHYYTNLKVVKLVSTMINNDVILELAKSNRKSLQKLCILTKYGYRMTSDEKRLPEIGSYAWQELTKSSPQVNVDFTFVTRIPHFELQELLKPEIPVTALNFMKYAECRPCDLEDITQKFNKTLKKFTDYSNSSAELDEAIKGLITKCEQINYFVHNGKIHHKTVRAIAKEKGRKLYFFQVNTDMIMTQEEDKDDEDQVLRKTLQGTYEVVAHSKLKTTLDIQSQSLVIPDMIKEVAHHLEQRWIPMDLLKRADIEQMKQELYGSNSIA